MDNNLKLLYKKKIVPSMVENFGYQSVEQVPKLVKISINKGLGKFLKNSKELERSLKEIAIITGQQPKKNKARKSIAGFKIREGLFVGGSVTLRNNQMYNFLSKLIHIALPGTRDFRGIKLSGFDNNGNYNLGLEEQLMFPEISYDDITQSHGLDIAFVTSAKTNKEALTLLQGFGMPFKIL